MELAIQRLFVVCFAVLGASHLLQPRAWGRFFITLHAKGDAGNFLNALLALAPQRATGFRVAGAAMLIVAGLLAYHVWVVAPAPGNA